MTKLVILLTFTGALSFAQTQAGPADETRKTDRAKGYHKATPKNTGATPASAKQTNNKAVDGKSAGGKNSDGLRTQTPPTRQPELSPPVKQ